MDILVVGTSLIQMNEEEYACKITAEEVNHLILCLLIKVAGCQLIVNISCQVDLIQEFMFLLILVQLQKSADNPLGFYFQPFSFALVKV